MKYFYPIDSVYIFRFFILLDARNVAFPLTSEEYYIDIVYSKFCKTSKAECNVYERLV